MSEPLIVQTLKHKRAEVLGQIEAYEAQIAHAKHDLAHVNGNRPLWAACLTSIRPSKTRA